MIRTDKLYDTLKDMQNKNKSPDQINDELTGLSVVTTYGMKKHTYKIESIDFNKSPTCTFKKGKPGEEVEVTFKDYYQTTYGCDIKDDN